MKYHYRFARLPSDKKVLNDLNDASIRLKKKLAAIDIDKLDIEDSSKSQFSNHVVAGIDSSLRRFSYILSWALANNHDAYEDFVLIDHGAGVGTMSLLAKELGIGTVIYNDLYEPYCRDARTIAQALSGDLADYYVHGNTDELVDFLKTNLISCNAIVSYDVIEHIYNIEKFLQSLPKMSNGPLTAVLASGANPFNPKTLRYLTRFHKKAEYGGRKWKQGCRDDYLTTAYLTVRKEIISKYASSLSGSEVEQIAKATRGLIEPDIKSVIDEYLKTGGICRQPDHPSNTVNPYTGNWAERLHNIDHLLKVMTDAGFTAEVLPGYYGGSACNNPVKRAMGTFFNCVISTLGSKGLILAPFYTLYARKA